MNAVAGGRDKLTTIADWRDDAACRGKPWSWFFGARPAELTEGRACCEGCRVVEVCLWSAMVDEETAAQRFGIWGGTPPATRAFLAATLGPGGARARLEAVVAPAPGDADASGATGTGR